MSDLVAFLTARLDEKEAAAKAANGDRTVWEAIITDDRESTRVIDSEQFTLAVWLDGDLAGHIARHDPARVLREVEAGRKIIAEHGDQHDCADAGVCFEWPYAGCRVLRHLAAVWNDHPGYDQAWKP